MIVLRPGDGLVGQPASWQSWAANAISKRALSSRPIMCRALGKNGVWASSQSLLTPQLSPVCRQAEAGGCISSPVRPSEKLRRDLPKVRCRGKDGSTTAASEPVLHHEIGIECAHRSAARMPRHSAGPNAIPIDDTLFSRPKRYFSVGDRMEDQWPGTP